MTTLESTLREIAYLKIPSERKGWLADLAVTRDELGDNPAACELATRLGEQERTVRVRLEHLVRAGLVAFEFKHGRGARRRLHFALTLPESQP